MERAAEGYDGDRDLRSISLVRTLLIALIAKTVGYAGAINGWEIGIAGLRATRWNRPTGGTCGRGTASSFGRLMLPTTRLPVEYRAR